MERRNFIKLVFGAAAGATVLAVSARAAPLSPISPQPDLTPSHGGERAEPAVVSQADVDHLKPEEVRWHYHWHRRHWGWHRRHWGWRHRHWHRRHWW